MVDRIVADIAELRKLLAYDPGTGIFTWRHDPRKRQCDNTRWAGKPAGSDNGKGYIVIEVSGTGIKAHRIAWAFVTGEWPESEIDHENHNRSDNRWDNLRLASRSQNQMNTGTYCTNGTGLKGVSYRKRSGLWSARVMKNGNSHWLGYFDTPETAHAAYCAKAAELAGEFFNPG